MALGASSAGASPAGSVWHIPVQHCCAFLPAPRRAANSGLPPRPSPPGHPPPGTHPPAPAELSTAGNGGSAGGDVTPGAQRGVSPPRDPRGGRGAPLPVPRPSPEERRSATTGQSKQAPARAGWNGQRIPLIYKCSQPRPGPAASGTGMGPPPRRTEPP